MWLYAFLIRHMPERAASAITALWLAALILAVFVAMFEPQADFRYGNL